MRRNFLGPLLLVSIAAQAQVPAFFDPPALEQRRKLPATRTKTAPDLDGDLSDAVWLEAKPTTDFVQSEPKQGEKASHRTVVRMLFDDDAIYVGVEMEQPGGWTAFNQRNMKRDFETNECDAFSILFDSLGDGRNAFVFAVNPFGAQRDVQIVDDSLVEPNWDTLWRVSTKRDEKGWSAEFAIPWKSLRYGGPGATWGIQFLRRERGINEDTVWSPIPRTVSASRMPYAGVISNLETPKPSLLSIQLRPYVIGRLQVTGDGPPTLSPSAGGEATWNPTSNTVLDLTGNTDFAEPDVHRRVVNPPRFSAILPARPALLPGAAGLFHAGVPGVAGLSGPRAGDCWGLGKTPVAGR